MSWRFFVSAVPLLLIGSLTVGLWILSEKRVDWWTAGYHSHQAGADEETVRGILLNSSQGGAKFELSLRDTYPWVPKYMTTGWRFGHLLLKARVPLKVYTRDIDWPGMKYWQLGNLGAGWMDNREEISAAILFPWWCIFIIVCLIAWRVQLSIYRRYVARPAGTYCRTCGYDLRATPDRCPECGAVPAGGSAPGKPGG